VDVPFERASFVFSASAILINQGEWTTVNARCCGGTNPRARRPHCVSMMPGGAHGDSEMTSLENEDHKGSQELA